MTCPYCKHNNKENAAKCVYCKAALNKTKETKKNNNKEAD